MCLYVINKKTYAKDSLKILRLSLMLHLHIDWQKVSYSFFFILPILVTIINELDTTMTNERAREKKEERERQRHSLFHLRFFSSLLMIEEKNILSLRKTFSFSLSLCRCLPLSTSPSLLFKAYRCLGATSTVESYTFYIIVVELWYPWMTRSSYLLDFQKYNLTIDYFQF